MRVVHVVKSGPKSLRVEAQYRARIVNLGLDTRGMVVYWELYSYTPKRRKTRKAKGKGNDKG